MPIPSTVLDALNAVQADADDLVTKSGAKQQTAAALASAQTADDRADHDLSASRAKLSTDLSALIVIEQQVYAGTPPSVPGGQP